MILVKDKAYFPQSPETLYADKQICVTGKITEHNGKSQSTLAQVSIPVTVRYLILPDKKFQQKMVVLNLILPILISLSHLRYNNRLHYCISNPAVVLQIPLFRDFHAGKQGIGYTFLYY